MGSSRGWYIRVSVLSESFLRFCYIIGLIESKTTDTHPLPIENLDDVRGYATSDLWEKHPTKDYLWRM